MTGIDSRIRGGMRAFDQQYRRKVDELDYIVPRSGYFFEVRQQSRRVLYLDCFEKASVAYVDCWSSMTIAMCGLDQEDPDEVDSEVS